ncbi:MAG: SNF2 helicase associated domain-containing protein [Myxococcales bacterium]|nr:SNF2 helicase associated domain-containing protein [Myxococcales bacterium]
MALVAVAEEQLGVPVRLRAGETRLLRHLARDVQWFSRAGRLSIIVGDWTQRERLELPMTAWQRHGLRALVPMDGQAPTLGLVAIALVVAWQDPAQQARLEPGRWRRALAGLERPEAAPAAEEPPAPGTIQVVLQPLDAAEPDPLAPVLGAVSIELVPSSRRTGAPLKPRPAPRSLAAIERKVQLSEGDRRLCRLAEQRRLLGHIQIYKYAGSSTVDDEVRRLDEEILRSLADVSAVRFGDEPLRVDPEPWRPRLAVTDGADGGLDLAFAEVPRALYPVGAGFVVLQDRLRPVAADVPTATLMLLNRGLPPVPASEVPAFVTDFVARAALPIELRARSLGVLRRPPTPRLLLTDSGDALEVAVRFGYGEVEITPDAEAEVLRAADGRLIQRDRAAERAALAQLAPLLPRLPPVQLTGEAALDFLLDGLGALDDWSIFLDERVRQRRPRGTVTVGARVETGSDWFDLQVDFALEGKAVKTDQVLAAWAEGRRYVELSDGRVARLPGEWLRRHGGAVGELEELRQGGRIGVFAAPLAAGLLAEIGGDRVAALRTLAERLEAFDRVPERALPPGLNAELRDYQHRGYRWLCALHDLGLGGILADDMGLGKTVQTLAFLLEVHRTPGAPSLVVAPTSVVPNWAQEVARFAPGLRVAVHHGAGRGEPPADVDLVITSYALLRVDQAHLVPRTWRVVVLDEAQAIKNPGAQIARLARSLTAATRLTLTGTPVENHLIELWSQFQFIAPGFFGNKAAFGRRYANPVQRHQDEVALAALRRRIRPFVLRRLKDEVARELPPRQEQIIYCELGPAQRQLYEKIRETWRATVLGAVDARGVGGATLQVLEALMRLRQACCDPHLLPSTEAAGVEAAAKLDRLMELVDALVEEGHRALVFSQWPSLLKRVEPRLKARKISYLYLDGSTKERGDLQTRWNADDGPPVFLISLKAGGTGMNLVGADHVIHLDPWWNPAVEQQATDRAHRIGQTRPVLVYKLVARGTVEEKILELQARKRSLAEATVDAERMVVDALTRADLEAVFAVAGEAALADDLDEPDEDGLPAAVVALLISDGYVSEASVAEVLGVADHVADALLRGWVKDGLLIGGGRTRARHYRRP